MNAQAPIVYPPAIVEPGTTWFFLAKQWLVEQLGLEKDALHIYFALFVLFASARLFRWRLSSWKPSAVVLAFALAGEAWDIRDGMLTSVPLSISLEYSLHDLLNTMFWPVAILLIARFTSVFDPAV